jgi:hypothetical protein
VHRIGNLFARRQIEVCGRAFVGLAHMVETARAQQPREAAHKTRSAVAHGIEKRRTAEAGGRLPGKRHASIVETADIERTVDQHRKLEPRAGAELKRAHAPLGTVGIFEQFDARNLAERARATFEFVAREFLTVQDGHVYFTAPAVRPLTM